MENADIFHEAKSLDSTEIWTVQVLSSYYFKLLHKLLGICVFEKQYMSVIIDSVSSFFSTIFGESAFNYQQH